MNGIWTISWRYFRSPIDRFNAVIQLLAIGGIAIGCMSLLLSLMITEGLEETIRHKLLSIDAHITLQNLESSEELDAETKRKINQILHISQLVSVGIYQGLTISHHNSTYPILLFTVEDLALYSSYNSLAKIGVNPDKDNKTTIIIDTKTAHIHNINIGDSLLFMGFDITQTPPKRYIQYFHIGAINDLSITYFEQSIALSSSASLLQQSKPNSTIWQVWVKDPILIDSTYQQIKRIIKFPWYAQTIHQKYENIMAWVELQQALGPVLVGVLLLIAVFNLIGTLLLKMVYYSRDLALLQSLGLTPIQTSLIIFIQGILTTFVGLFIGLIIASILAYSQQLIPWFPLPEQNFFIDYVPVAFRFWHYAWIIFIAFCLCVLISWFSAYFVLKTNTLSIIRWRK